MIHFDRRSFLKASCLAAGAGVLSSAESLAAAVLKKFTRILPQPLTLTASEDTVLTFVRRYSSNVRLVGRSVLAKLRGTETREAHLLAELSEVAKFEAALAGPLPFAAVYSQADTFSFVLEGIEFTVENLLPAAFAARLTELVAKKNVAFAHDALSYDPATRALTDPFGAEKSRAMKLVNTTVSGAAALGLAVRSRVEGGRLRMEPEPVFTQWERRNLALAANVRNAESIAEAFLQQLATLSDAGTPATVKALLRTRAVASSLQRTFGVEVANIIAGFDTLRPTLRAEISNGALWLSLIVGPEIESESADGAATTWLRRGTRFEVLRSRQALREARQLLSSNS